MKILLLNQCFYPDVVSTAQHLTDLLELAAQGHAVTVLTGRRGYDDPATWYAARTLERHFDHPHPQPGAGKAFQVAADPGHRRLLGPLRLRLALLPRYDVVVALTSPPLISLLGALFARRRPWVHGARAKLVCWVMDLNPDEAVAAGWLRERSWVTRILDRMLLYSFSRAERIVALDRFMKDRIIAKGVSAEKLVVIPPWSHDRAVRYDDAARQCFRAAHGLSDKFVVMYSGNHSPCHPLDTLLEAVRQLACEPQFAFCFVGGGKEFVKVQRFAEEHRLENVHCLPYQALDQLSASLSAADLHVVVLGEPFVGIVHPCKVYNILRIGSPLLAISPTPSHLTDLLAHGDWTNAHAVVPHGDVEGVVERVRDSAAIAEWRDTRYRSPAAVLLFPGRVAATSGRFACMPADCALTRAGKSQGGMPAGLGAGRGERAV